MTLFRKHARRLAAMAWLAAAMALASCNAQKNNTALSRQYTAFITRYNVHYNGDKHFRETLADIEDKYIDDYTRLLPMHPVEAQSEGSSGLFNRSIEKAQKAIQTRSIKKKPRRQPGRSSDPAYKEWLKREEYNPVLHDDWLLLGKSQYFNGDFDNAASTFMYIAKHFPWLPATVTEAKLWQALSYVSLGWLDEADIILSRIKPSQTQSDRHLYALYNYAYADYWIHRKQYANALPYLRFAAEHASGAQRTRLTFLTGQLYQLTGNNGAALQAYKQAGSGSSTPYHTKVNARIRQSEVTSGANVNDEIKALRRMTRYSRNKQYLSQIYYALGNLHLVLPDTVSAIDSYLQSIASDTGDAPGMLQSRLALGNVYYTRGEYQLAQPCYAAAVAMLDDKADDYEHIKRRSDILDRLSVLAQSVTLQDSLLRLAAMPRERQMSIAQALVARLKETERKQAEAEDHARNIATRRIGQAGELTDRNARHFEINSDDSWYFYNPAVTDAGRAAFQRQWGARKLEDDWRRSNKYTFAAHDDYDEDAEEADADINVNPENTAAYHQDTSSDPHQPEFYLAQIPSTPAQIALANGIVQEGLYDMGLILKDNLDNPAAASDTWLKLLQRYPDNAYRLDIYYNMYVMEMQHGHADRAEHWRQLILSQFAESTYGQALKNERYFELLLHMDREQEQLYANTYRQYLRNANDSVHAAARYMEQTYPTSKLMPQFLLLDALAHLTDGDPQNFNSTLTTIVAKYPDAANAPLASAWLKGMSQGRTLYRPGENVRGMVWQMPLSADTAAQADSTALAGMFTRDDDSPQVIALVFPSDIVSSNELLYQVARHNFRSFVVKDFDLETLNFGTLGVIVISGFDNMRQIEHYKSVLTGSATLVLPPEVHMVTISRRDFDTLVRQGLTFDDYFRVCEQSQNTGQN